MSKIKLQGNDTGTGVFTITSPGTNTNRSLTLPDTAGEFLTADTNGNVGIGTTSPGGNSVNRQLTLNGTTAQATFTNGTFNTNIGNNGSLGYIEVSGATPLTFYTNNSERMRIDSSGNVAIGHTTTTGSKFAICDGGSSQIQFFPEITTDTNLIQHYDPTAAVYIKSDNRASEFTFKTGTTERMTISSTGSTSIAWNDAGTYKGLGVSITGGSTTYRANSDGGNGCHHFRSDYGSTNALKAYVQNNGSYYNASDYRLKENIADMSGGIDSVKQLRPVTFNMIGTEENVTGFIAHEVKEVIDHLVDGDKDQLKEDGETPYYQFLNYSGIVPTLTQALKEAITKIEALETRIETLENA